MDKQQLIDSLKNSHYPEDSYGIDKIKNESLCLVEEHGRWVIFYSEKGQRSDLEHYDSRDAACSEFLREYREMMNHL